MEFSPIPGAPLEFRFLEQQWKAVALGFLVEKVNRSGSQRTLESYARNIRGFLNRISDPATVTPMDIHRFAYGIVDGGLPPSASTVSVRLAAISGFYDFAVRMGVLDANPATRVGRPRARRPAPRGLTLSEVAQLLQAMPETAAGRLDRAITVTALFTGLRRSELFSLRIVGPVLDRAAVYEARTKGGRLRRRELPEPAWHAILAAAPTRPDASESAAARVFPISESTFYAHLRHYGKAAGLGPVSPHVLRHTAAKLRRQAGASIEEVSSLLGHQSIATTATYLKRLEEERDEWQPVAELLWAAGVLRYADAHVSVP